MYTGLLHTHHFVRYAVLIMLLAVIFKSLLSLVSQKPFQKLDNTFSLVLLIFTHIQGLAGILLYFISDKVQFSKEAMKLSHYFTFEHAFGMLLAIVLITIARVTMKKIPDDAGKFKRLVFLNTLALIVIISTLLMGKLRIIG